jgi:hypothetical protein
MEVPILNQVACEPDSSSLYTRWPGFRAILKWSRELSKHTGSYHGTFPTDQKFQADLTP